MQFLDKVCLHFVVQRQVSAGLDIPVVAQRQFPMVHFFMLMVQFSDKVFDVVHSPFEWLDHRCHCSCRSLVLFVGSLPRCESVCVAMSCGVVFTPGGASDSVWGSVKPMTGKYIVYCFQYQEDVRCVCMLNFCSAALTIFAQTTTTIPGSS